MHLAELFGAKRYHERDFFSVMRDFVAAGGEQLGHGRFASVIGHASWPYVLKIFADDPCYLAFVEWAQHQSHPCLPRFIGRPRLITPFWRRTAATERLYVVKQERLREEPDQEMLRRLCDMLPNADHYLADDAAPELTKAIWLDQQARIEMTMIEDELRKNPPPDLAQRLRDKRRELRMDLNPHAEQMHELREFWSRHPGTRTFMEMVVNLLMRSPIRCEIDAHPGNIMRRPSDGSLVFVDPFWTGESPVALHDRLMRAEQMVDDEPEMLRGGQRSQPKTYAAREWDGDIPF